MPSRFQEAAAEDRFRNLFEHSPIAIWEEDFTEVIKWFGTLRSRGVVDLRRHLNDQPDEAQSALKLVRVLDVNAEAISQNGATCKEDLLKRLPQLLPATALSVWIEELSQLWEGEQVIQIETESVRLDGSIINMLMRIQVPGPPATPRWEAVIVTGTEITERKQVEARLAEQNRLAILQAEVGMALNQPESLRDILKGCCECILRQTGASFVRIWTLNAAESVLELQASVGIYTHIDGKHSRIPVGSFKIGAIAATRQAILSNEVIGDPRVPEQEWAKREGMIAFAGHPLINDDKVVGVLGMFACNKLTTHTQTALRGVADAIALGVVRKRAEAALQASETRLRSVLASALDCIITINRTGKIIEFNPAAERIFGFSRAEVLGHELSGLILTDDHRSAHLAGLERYLRTRESKILGQRLRGLPARCKDGNIILVELTVVATEVNGDIAFTGFLSDITEQVKLEEQRQQTAADAHHAREEAEAASLAKTHFLANISHEFRTPLAAVVGYSEMLLDPLLDVHSRMSTIYAIRRNASHLLALINNVLDFTKMEAGRLEVERFSFNIWRTIGEALSVAGVNAQEKNLLLGTVTVGPVPRRITTDATRLRHIIDNLLSNAVKFSTPGKTVNVRLRLDKEHCPPKLQISVEDEGIGIRPEVMDRLFQPFQQADASTTRLFGGTGLGLSISKRLAHALGGELTVQSTENVGSCFTLSLPVSPADLDDLVEESDLINESALVRPKNITPTQMLTGTALLAEDNPDNRNIIRYFLERVGLRVDTAENGQIAVEKANATEYDIILMDMQMPVLDGYTATSLLRQQGYQRSIVALTAHAMAGDEEKCLKAGCNAYLAKPVNAEQLLSVVAHHLPRRSWVIKSSSTIRQPHAAEPKQSFDSLLHNFRASLQDKLHDLKSSQQIPELIASHAHKLKGSAGMFGFPGISETAGLIEDACREGQSQTLIDELLDDLCDMINAATAES